MVYDFEDEDKDSYRIFGTVIINHRIEWNILIHSGMSSYN